MKHAETFSCEVCGEVRDSSNLPKGWYLVKQLPAHNPISLAEFDVREARKNKLGVLLSAVCGEAHLHTLISQSLPVLVREHFFEKCLKSA
jgi:hypothetical protein